MKNMIGAYGPWAASMLPTEPSALSLQECPADEFESRRAAARARVLECMAPPPKQIPKPTVLRRFEYDGLEIEELSWPQPAGEPTQAWVFKPANATGSLPGVLALHDHGGFKFYGKEKIAQIGPEVHTRVKQHYDDYYGGLAWVNELARRGHVVLVHDTFTFGSRRVRLADVPEAIHWGLKDDADESTAGTEAYDKWALEHEHVMAKSLFCAGTTWPGVFYNEDKMALDVLCNRPDVDADRIGVCGLSGGGIRTVYLAGLDERVKCAVCIGMMTTWRDFMLNKSFTHTWMCYVPHLARELDFSEIYGLRAPRATMVMNTHEDGLFTHEGMKDAEKILNNVYHSAGVPERFKCSWYDGPHQFNREMQIEAFEWLERWLV